MSCTNALLVFGRDMTINKLSVRSSEVAVARKTGYCAQMQYPVLHLQTPGITGMLCKTDRQKLRLSVVDSSHGAHTTKRQNPKNR